MVIDFLIWLISHPWISVPILIIILNILSINKVSEKFEIYYKGDTKRFFIRKEIHWNTFMLFWLNIPWFTTRITYNGLGMFEVRYFPSATFAKEWIQEYIYDEKQKKNNKQYKLIETIYNE